MKTKISALTLSLMMSSCAYAASGTLTYSGTVSTTCAFSNITNATLGVAPQTANILWTNSPGTPAGLTIDYVGTPTMSVEAVSGFTTKPNGVADGDFTYTTSVTSSNGATYSLNSGYYTHSYTTGNQDNLTVNLGAAVSNGDNVPLGSYATSSIITCQ